MEIVDTTLFVDFNS